MKKTRVAILFLLLTLFAACLPAAAELPAQITLPCLGKDRVHKLIEYVDFGNVHHGRYQCTHCGYKVIPYWPYEGHSGGTETPTCTTGKICLLCWSEYGILGHDWGEWTSDGDGTHTRRCKRSNCGAVDNAALCSGGTATCTAKAVCAVCGKEYGEKDPDNHALVQHEAQAPTCTEPGWDAYEGCTRSGCNYTTYHVRPALNHNLVRHDAQAATCTEKGWNAYETCSRFGCNYTTYQEIPALKHNLVRHTAKAPTCTEKGWNAYETCSRCDHTTYAELPALNHDYQAVTVDPTCEADGYTVFTCSRCKDSYTADPTRPAGTPVRCMVSERDRLAERRLSAAGLRAHRQHRLPEVYLPHCGRRNPDLLPRVRAGGKRRAAGKDRSSNGVGAQWQPFCGGCDRTDERGIPECGL